MSLQTVFKANSSPKLLKSWIFLQNKKFRLPALITIRKQKKSKKSDLKKVRFLFSKR